MPGSHRKPGPAHDWVGRPGFLVFFNAPVAIVICGFDDGYGQAVQDCNRAGQNLMLSAHARGLGTCWVGSPMQWLRDPATCALLGVPADYTPHAAFTLGYPESMPPPRHTNCQGSFGKDEMPAKTEVNEDWPGLTTI